MTDLAFLTELLGNIKDIKRTGWIKRDIKNSESVADHCYGVTLLTALLCPKELNKLHCLEMAVYHDLQEALVGDIIAFKSSEEDQEKKRQIELEAITKIANKLNTPQLIDLHHEYNANQTPEAQFVKSIDKLEVVMQAKFYCDEDRAPCSVFEEFYENAHKSQKVKDKNIKLMIDQLAK